MWVILGPIAIVITFINLYMYAAGKDYKLAMAMALSFTALRVNEHFIFKIFLQYSINKKTSY